MALPMILPKGIVVNSPGISQDIAQKAMKPMTPDEIFKFWKVYTTTKRVLKDPTAERLENLFWRIWGSKKTKLGRLSSTAIAQVFVDISQGKTATGIGLLKSPVLRDESGVPSRRAPSRFRSEDLETLGSRAVQSRLTTPKATLKPPRSLLSSKNTRRRKLPSQDLVRTAQLNSASLQATSIVVESDEIPTPDPALQQAKAAVLLPQPILKKARGQSSTGPKPTARFAESPTGSDVRDEDALENDSDDSPSNSKVVVRPPTPEEHDPTPHKFRPHLAAHRRKSSGRTTATMGYKKRPVLGRRPSSQSSTGSDTSVRRHENITSGSVDVPAMKSSALAQEMKKPKQQSKFQENFSPAEEAHFISSLNPVQPRNPRGKLAQQNGLENSKPTPLSDKARGKQRADHNEQVIPCSHDGAQKVPQHSPISNSVPPTKNQDGSKKKNIFAQEQQIAETKACRSEKQPTRNENGAAKQAPSDLKPEVSQPNQDTPLPPPPPLPRRSMPAINLSAAYASARRSSNEKAEAQTSSTFALPSFDIPAETFTDDSTASADSQAKVPKGAMYLSRSGISSKASAAGLVSASPTSNIGASSFGNRSASRSVSNLTMLLQRDDVAKAAKVRKLSLGKK